MTHADIIALVKKAKSCDFVKDLMDEYEVDNVGDLADELADERDMMLEECE